jgi:leader peptidase (prepilin peptidase) / N-methyltransferase
VTLLVDVAVFLGVFGALIGSFLNVVIYRVPAKKSIVSPPSACGNCGHHIRAYDNIPLISWLVLRGRCRDCGSKISARYPLVELGTALFFGVVAVWGIPQVLVAGSEFDALGVGIELVALLYLAAISVALAMIDIDTHKLPNSIVLPAYGVGAVLLSASSILTGSSGSLVSALIGAAALFFVYFALFFFVPGGMGFGDVKLAGVLGLFLGYLGWGPLIVGALGAFLLGGIFSIVLLVSRRGTGKSKVPFGPWMLGGAWLGIFAGAPIASWYLSIFGLGGS